MKLTNKVAVVTGGYKGIGRGIVDTFIKYGAKVIVLDYDENVTSMKSDNILAYVVYIRDRQSVTKAVKSGVSYFGKLDILVNNSGVMDDMAPMAEASDEKYEKVFAVNVYGPMAAMRKSCQVFLEQGNGGCIINISSVGSMHQAAGPVYCASKAALNAFTTNTAFVYEQENIRCNAIAAGGFQTEIANSMGMPNMTGYKRYSQVVGLAAHPTGDPIEIARAALFLATDEASFISGAILPVDGGWMSF